MRNVFVRAFCSLARYGDKGASAGITMRKGARTAQRRWRRSNAINSCRFAPRPSVGYFDDVISLSLSASLFPSIFPSKSFLNAASSSANSHPRSFPLPSLARSRAAQCTHKMKVELPAPTESSILDPPPPKNVTPTFSLSPSSINSFAIPPPLPPPPRGLVNMRDVYAIFTVI